MGDVRSLDHFVIAVHDADAAGRTYERLGFQALALMRHAELGCCNRVIQLQETYLELLGGLDKSVPALRDRLTPRFACGEGLTITALRSFDLDQDRNHLRQLKFETGPIFSARRTVTMPDGASQETDSRAFYVWRPERLYATLFFTQHLKPETIWISAYQAHPNTAQRVTCITYVSADPRMEVEYVAKLLGQDPLLCTADRALFHTRRGERIEFLSPAAQSARYGDACAPACASQPVYGIALEVEVADMNQCRDVLACNGVNVDSRNGRLRVPADLAHGVVMDFVPGSSHPQPNAQYCAEVPS